MFRPFLRKRRRGLTLPEVLISAFIMLGIVFVLTQFARINNILWQRGVADNAAQGDAQQAIQRLAPYIRKARRVVTGGSNASMLTLRLPLYDVDGNLVTPLQDGDQVQFYLSNSTGNTGSTGNILWLATNNSADTTWALASGRGRVQLQSLAFTYAPTSDPESVTISVTSSRQVGTSTQTFTTSQEVVLRNKLD
jgi:hypothetical protein